MALVWQKKTNDTLYEVRSAGKSLRLYTNGVFHTQYNPANPVTGHIWDLLMLPAFFLPKAQIQRVLVLGVGGGAAIQLLKQFIQPEKIVGIELNPVHIYIARRFFKLKDKSIALIEYDAVEWLVHYRGEKFDMIIDDLFYEEEGEPVPVTRANVSWFNLLLRNLSSDGVIVRNFVDKQELKKSAGVSHASTNKRFSSIFQLTTTYNENFAAVYLRKLSSAQALRKRLVQIPALNPSLKTSRLRYKIRRLK
jgi:spermidine synthase